jgi:putative intracellular protease/amidase
VPTRQGADPERGHDVAKVLMLASNMGLWGEELQAPWDLLKEAGHELTLATNTGKKPLPHVWSVTKEFRDPLHNLINVPEEIDRFFELLHSGEWDSPLKIDEAETTFKDDYDAIVITGGPGAPLDLNGNPAVLRMVVSAWQDGKVIGALCYAVAALCLARQPDDYPKSVVRGKTICAHPMEWDFRIPITYPLAEATPDNPGTSMTTPGFVYPLRPLVEGAVGPEGTVVSPPTTTRENPCAVIDMPFVTGLSFESSIAFGQKLVEALDGK